jgi:hypothetical protein
MVRDGTRRDGEKQRRALPAPPGRRSKGSVDVRVVPSFLLRMRHAGHRAVRLSLVVHALGERHVVALNVMEPVALEEELPPPLFQDVADVVARGLVQRETLGRPEGG